MNGIKFSKRSVDSKLARELLGKNIVNRNLKEAVVARYAKEMKEGRWKEDTAEFVKISDTGKLIDGQHRLHAIIKAGVSINLHIAEGIEEDRFKVIDTGSIRNASDCFKVAGVKNGTNIPAIIQLYYILKEGMESKGQVNNRKTPSQLLDHYYSREDFWQNTFLKAQQNYHAFQKILPVSYIGGFYSLFYDIDEFESDNFISQLCTGRNIENNTVFLLRNKIIEDSKSQRKMPQPLKWALTIKAWNYFRTNNEVKILKYDTQRDNFPIPL